MLPVGCKFNNCSFDEKPSTFRGDVSLELVTLMTHSDIYGCVNDYNNNVEVARVKSIVEACDEAEYAAINKDKIRYEILDLNTTAKMEYMLWLMDIDMNEFIDDWKGPHSLLVTSYIFNY